MNEEAIIKISNGNCHLEFTFNYDASEPIQIEEYDQSGWNEPQARFKGMSDRQFWDIWCDWNGRMCGGITLHDGKTDTEINLFCSTFGDKAYTVADIPTLPDGLYRIWAKTN